MLSLTKGLISIQYNRKRVRQSCFSFDPNWLLFQLRNKQRQFLNSTAYSADLLCPRWNYKECILYQGWTLTDLHKVPACDAGIGDQLVQSLCASMVQTLSSVALFTASPVEKDFTENIKTILKLVK